MKEHRAEKPQNNMKCLRCFFQLLCRAIRAGIFVSPLASVSLPRVFALRFGVLQTAPLGHEGVVAKPALPVPQVAQLRFLELIYWQMRKFIDDSQGNVVRE
ncbi:MAG TPA: hypothetical protein VNT99_01765 [Methylomirabilota bacterium]|nr:hypothetical protein [Methylomirabilota bacterium]